MSSKSLVDGIQLGLIYIYFTYLTTLLLLSGEFKPFTIKVTIDRLRAYYYHFVNVSLSFCSFFVLLKNLVLSFFVSVWLFDYHEVFMKYLTVIAAYFKLIKT